MGRLGAAMATMLLAACAATPLQESSGEYVDDSAITAQVKSAFIGDEQVSALAVGVETFKGVVQLSGFVNSAQERAKAESLARTVNGVKGVQNDIHLK
jgi:osmotically-inducible protein OsmY